MPCTLDYYIVFILLFSNFLFLVIFFCRNDLIKQFFYHSFFILDALIKDLSNMREKNESSS